MIFFNNIKLKIAVSFCVIIMVIVSCAKKDAYIPALAKPVITSFSATAAYAGDSILITGTNFGGVGNVSFGGINAISFKILSLTSISAFVGAGNSGFVTVLAAGGNDSIKGFTYLGLKPVDGYVYSNDVEFASLIANWSFDGNDTEMVHKSIPILRGGTSVYVNGKIGQAIQLTKNWLTYPLQAAGTSAANVLGGTSDVLKNGFTLSMWTQLPDTSLLTNLFQLSVAAIPNFPVLGLGYKKNFANHNFDMLGGIGNIIGTDTILTRQTAFKIAIFSDTLPWAFLTMVYNPLDRTLNYYANGDVKASVILASLGANNPFKTGTEPLLMATPNYATIGTFESAATTPNDMSLTTIPATMSSSLTGIIDDIRLFNKPLSAKKINDLYLLGNLGR